jgi:hypothetical protein
VQVCFFIKKYILTVFLILGIHLISYAQGLKNLTYQISSLSQDDGLSQGSNYFRYEDSKGYVWLTANDALNRYDGIHVKVYNLDAYFKNCPNLQQSYGFAEDNDANLYTGSARGLYKYHRTEDKFSLIKIYPNRENPTVMPIGVINGKLWCFNLEFKLASLDIKSNEVKVYNKLPLEAISSLSPYESNLNHFYYNMPILVKNGTIYAANNNKMVTYNTATGKISEPLKDYIKEKIRVNSSCYDSINNKILFGLNEGLLEYDINKSICRKKNIIEKESLENIICISVGRNYIAFRTNKELMIANKQLNEIKKGLLDKVFAPHLAITPGFDKNDRLWISLNAFGQKIIDFGQKLLPSVTHSTPKLGTYIKSGIGRIGHKPTGEIVLPGLDNTRFNSIYFNPNDYTFKMEHSNFLLKQSMLEYATDEKRKGIWIFYQYPTELSKTKFYINYFDNKNLKKTYLAMTDTLGLMQNALVLKNGNIMCAFQTGLYYYLPEKNYFTKIKGGEIKNAFVINLINENRIAVSYLNKDIHLYRLLDDGSLKFIKTVLPGVQSFYLSHDTLKQTFWVGTNMGIYLLDKDFNNIKKFDANNGLAGTFIYGLLIGDDHNIYCSHQKGLSCINSKNFNIVNFDKEDGIQDWDFHNRSFCKTKDGYLCFGGAIGFNYFKPPLRRQSNYKPEVYIDNILINNKAYLGSNNYNKVQTLYLKPSENNIKINAIVKELANAKSYQIIYKFLDKDSTFHYLPNNTPIVFNSLAGDDYILQIGFYNKYTGEEIIQKEIKIEIAIPFYKKIWFIGLIALVTSSIVFYWITKNKLTKQKNIFKQQLALQEQRQDITANLHDDIGATLSSLQLNSNIAKKLLNTQPEKTNIILGTIETQAKELSEKVGDIIWSMKEDDEAFGSFSDRIRTYTNQILDYTDIDYELNIANQVDSYINNSISKKNILLITKEAINNAVKYSQAKK